MNTPNPLPPAAIALSGGDALLIVDVQNDFLPGGSLAVPTGDEVIAPLNRAIAAFASHGLPIFATRDWHPPHHCSFKTEGGTWPPHCVAGSHGAAFAARLRLPVNATVVSKATEADADAYSGFEGTTLAMQLRSRGVKRLFVGGLASDYCVLTTVADALTLGFDVVLLLDAVRPVELRAGDGKAAVDEMERLGAQTFTTDQLPALGT